MNGPRTAIDPINTRGEEMYTDVYLFYSMTFKEVVISRKKSSDCNDQKSKYAQKHVPPEDMKTGSEVAVFHMLWLAELILPFNSHRSIEHTWEGQH